MQATSSLVLGGLVLLLILQNQALVRLHILLITFQVRLGLALLLALLFGLGLGLVLPVVARVARVIHKW